MPTIRHSIRAAAAPETIYPLVSTVKGFTQWWAADATEKDGAVELGFHNRRTTYACGSNAASRHDAPNGSARPARNGAVRVSSSTSSRPRAGLSFD